jgi:NADH:ubiquinone oxidoreductase subunit F (NADH-binding)
VPGATTFVATTARGLEPRLLGELAGGREECGQYRRSGGYAPGGATGTGLIEAVESAGLRGRGGAAFPTGVKLRAVRERPGPRCIVANGEEGEPASIKDRWLLRHRPHLVLDGLLRAAEAVDAATAHVLVSDQPAAESVATALEELGPTAVPIELFTVSHAYVAGEETAVVRVLDGGPALPLDKPPRPFERGVGGRPTLVANVETLANIPGIAVRGPAWFRTAGTAASPGTVLLTVSGACERPGLYETPLGVSLRQLLADAGVPDEPLGVLMGGFFGGVLGPHALDVPLGYDELRQLGSGLGCGAMIVLGRDDCAVAAAADVMGFLSRENAKQCGACIRGTGAMADVLCALAGGTAEPDQLERLRGWSMSLRGRGACALLDAATTLATSLLRGFPDAIDSHMAGACERCAALMPADGGSPSRFELTI